MTKINIIPVIREYLKNKTLTNEWYHALYSYTYVVIEPERRNTSFIKEVLHEMLLNLLDKQVVLDETLHENQQKKFIMFQVYTARHIVLDKHKSRFMTNEDEIVAENLSYEIDYDSTDWLLNRLVDLIPYEDYYVYVNKLIHGRLDKDIAEDLGVCQQRVSVLYRKVHKIIKEYATKYY